jgi:hypothetical protein
MGRAASGTLRDSPLRRTDDDGASELGLYSHSGCVAESGHRVARATATFDRVPLESVFSRMLTSDMRSYLRELSLVLTAAGARS